ncbi:MAG: hypothetical protein AAAC47_30110 [Pararhizobium sp.]
MPARETAFIDAFLDKKFHDAGLATAERMCVAFVESRDDKQCRSDAVAVEIPGQKRFAFPATCW